ncbi:hypothetical protein QWY86_02925 [Pedobacter aquatilis]|uniref:hypothetical protein n=1 Tax=Pedobacter aquatilis TaxID=351343 RepID=UPI0025B4B4FB|nr:hypothetical protein [Pedobacter aquatilis]MDN3585604.1 hypothetical protein [Pedobacter aquatilis]
MFTKSKTRILFLNSEVIVLTKIQADIVKCQIFVDGINKGHLVELDGMFVPEDNCNIAPFILSRINALALKSKAA